MARVIQTTVGTWKGMPAGFDFDGDKNGVFPHHLEGSWDSFQSREVLLEHYDQKEWTNQDDVDAIAQLWDEFAGT